MTTTTGSTTTSKQMAAIPAEVREYLSSGDGLGQAAAHQRHPQLRQTLQAADTRVAILGWLATEESKAEAYTGFCARCLQFLRPEIQAREVATVRPFLLHDAALVRTAAYELLITLYFPDRNREALH